ncbi:PPOX class F420-dependent enzyme [Streptomyces longisporoflavus]|uniref:pyridoxamine 5'-phosphate oxidase family protein n=1 Tax=Streptomyces longisporoflavus TaxID=28044 RepID=UPI00167D31CA|nr:pyridoxamine 5'-phosphate oxidase family protein [Streptomyces longisporoflavus]GGV55442.1 PPOX class F420-dependent enzyme [Streptomyces longisporoflavus]
MAIDPHHPTPAYLSFWRERHLCTLTTPRPDGTPHVVPVCVTYDPEAGVARVLASRSSAKVRNVLAATEAHGSGGARVAVCQVDGARWATLEGIARVRTEPAEVAEGERRYEERYGKPPRVNPNRAVIEISLTRAMGARVLKEA